jgi:hypothetical protein
MFVTPKEYRKYKIEVAKAKALSSTKQSELERSYEREVSEGTFTDSYSDYVRQWRDTAYRRFKISEDRGELPADVRTFPEFLEKFPSGITIGEKLQYRLGVEDIKDWAYLTGPELRVDAEKSITDIEEMMALTDAPEGEEQEVRDKLLFNKMEALIRSSTGVVERVERGMKNNDIGWWVTRKDGEKEFIPF